MKRTLLSLLSFVLIGLSQAVAADFPAVERPTFMVGDEYRICGYSWYDTSTRTSLWCSTWIYKSKDGEKHVFAKMRPDNKIGEVVYDLDMGTLNDDGRIFSPTSGMLKFPLVTGKAWSVTYTIEQPDGSKQTRTREAKIVGQEKLETAMGTIDAIRVETWNKRHDRQLPAREVYWYCPSIGMVCQYESKELESRYKVVAVKRNVAAAKTGD